MRSLPARVRPALFAVAFGCDPQPGAVVTVAASPAPSLAAAAAGEPEPSEAPPRFLKGQLHLHSGNSGDSQTPPPEVARWYAEHGYDFIVFTDHNFITVQPHHGEMLVLAGVELTQNLASCDPPPETRYGCLLHVDALFVEPPGDPRVRFAPSNGEPRPRAEVYAHGVERALALGGIAQLNHPNFRWAADAEVVAAVARHGALLMEIANQSYDSKNEGDATHPSTEALWDAALTGGARLYGTATDDAHHYYDAAEVAAAGGDPPYVGDLGWVMVRAAKDAAAIEAAIARGDFYSTTGVLLSELDQRWDHVALALDPRSQGEALFEVIGADGAVVHQARGRALRWSPGDGASSYWRVRVSLGDKRAWTQPVFRP
jgi:hypothetical protein